MDNALPIIFYAENILFPSRSIFIAAFLSLSSVLPHLGQVHSLNFRFLISMFWYPHLEHSWLDGKKRSISTTDEPVLCAIYFSLFTKSANPKSDIFLPKRFCIAFRFKSSRHIRAYSPTSLLANCQWKLSLWFATFLCNLAKASLAFLRLLEPLALRDKILLALFMAVAFCLKNSGEAISLPSEAFYLTVYFPWLCIAIALLTDYDTIVGFIEFPARLFQSEGLVFLYLFEVYSLKR